VERREQEKASGYGIGGGVCHLGIDSVSKQDLMRQHHYLGALPKIGVTLQ
jgi:hypothetical protein